MLKFYKLSFFLLVYINNMPPKKQPKRKPAPKGFHYMPNGKLMKDSLMKKGKKGKKKY